MDKEIYIRKLIDKDNFAYVMLNVKKTNYLGEYASLILVTEYGDYFIPCSLSLNEKFLTALFNNQKIWTNLTCFYYEKFDEDKYNQYGQQYSSSYVQMRNDNRWETCNHENKNLTLKIVGSTT